MGTDRRKSGRSSLPSGSEEKAAKRARPNSETSQELFKKAQGGSEPGEDVQHHNYRPVKFWGPNPTPTKEVKLTNVMKKCLAAVKTLSKRQNGFFFAEAFDPEEMGIPDYFDIVTRAMDFTSIQEI
ncbi:hypothetical protein T484DRAFT_1760107 [Baffinella frigidus]|nr:hypothetical protein T484DRAFT_1760107 [Cryptophyta sp. CCMP2293]